MFKTECVWTHLHNSCGSIVTVQRRNPTCTACKTNACNLNPDEIIYKRGLELIYALNALYLSKLSSSCLFKALSHAQVYFSSDFKSHRKPLKKPAFSRISSQTWLSLDLAFTHTVTAKTDLSLTWGSSVKTLVIWKKKYPHVSYHTID